MPFASSSKNRLVYLKFLKWIFMFVIGYMVLKLVDTTQIQNHLAAVSLGAVALFLALAFVARLFYSARWFTIATSVNITGVTLYYFTRVILLSEFVGIVLPSYLGSDGVRLVKLRQFTQKNSRAVFCILLDRIVGVASMAVLTLFLLPVVMSLLQLDQTFPLWTLFTLAIAIFGMAYVIFRRHQRGRLADKGQSAENLKPTLVIAAFVMSALGHLIFVTGYFILFRVFAPVEFLPVVAIVLMALLTRSIPVSILGVEVSDGSLVALASLIGVETEKAIIVVAIVVGSRYVFALGGVIMELISDGKQIFVTPRIRDIARI